MSAEKPMSRVKAWVLSILSGTAIGATAGVLSTELQSHLDRGPTIVALGVVGATLAGMGRRVYEKTQHNE